MIPRKTAATLAVAGLALAVTACSASVNTEPDEVSIVYSAARGSATTFSKCVPAAAREGVSMSDNSWTYPAGQRTFQFTADDGAESKPISVVSKDNVQLTVPGFVTFALNTDCATLRQFHERIGLKFRAYFYGTETSASSEDPDVSGWVAMLNTYLKGPLDRAMDAASQEFEWKKLYNDPVSKAAWEKRVGDLIGQEIVKSGGGQFFCQPNFAGKGECGSVVLTLQKPQPPDNLVQALAASEAAKAQNLAQQQINTKIDTELESMKKVVDVLGWQGYIQLKAIESGRVQFILPQGSAVNVAPK